MSRGAGVVMLRALEVVRQADRPLESQEIARQVFGLAHLSDLTPAQAGSVRRALRALSEGGEVEDMGRGWMKKRRKWATPEGAAKHRAWSAAFLAAAEEKARARGQR